MTGAEYIPSHEKITNEQKQFYVPPSSAGMQTNTFLAQVHD